jgi:hypothetical protein
MTNVTPTITTEMMNDCRLNDAIFWFVLV